jgi:AcrR family transcriptional regulator
MESSTAKRARDARRLDRTDWLRAGCEALVRSGPEALTLARLARSLGVTTGSFYWHFRNRGEFIGALLDHWIRDVLEATGHEARATAPDGRDQIRELERLLASRRLPELDAAMRGWARTDARAAEAVQRADELRVSFLAAFFRSAGVKPEDARLRAEIAMGYWIGSFAAGSPRSLASRGRRMGALVQMLAGGAPPIAGRRRATS